MKDFIRFFIVQVAILIIMIILLVAATVTYKVHPLDKVVVNDCIETVVENWDSPEKLESAKFDIDILVLDRSNHVVYSSSDSLFKGIKSPLDALEKDMVTVAVNEDERFLGTCIIPNPSKTNVDRTMYRIIVIVVIVSVAMLLSYASFYYFVNRNIIKPFNRMKKFASMVAMGDLDEPLAMEKNNIFGIFTESFDIMREELKASRLREEAAVKSRKELVAELSHDIKTPVSSIKAMVDVMMLTTEDEAEKETLQSINAKADQIDKLISNLFHATLEELEQLEVKPEELSSDRIRKMIAEADFRKLTTTCDIKDAAVLADSLRLEQVINNIYSNSYKYAGTPITVTSRFEEQEIEFSDDTDFDEQDDKTDINSGTENDKLTDVVFKNTCNYLVIDFCDEGGGVPEEELEIIMEKFRRGSNSAGKSGSGIGLYISRYLMDKMEGGLDCSNNPKGFTVTVRLKLI